MTDRVRDMDPNLECRRRGRRRRAGGRLLYGSRARLYVLLVSIACFWASLAAASPHPAAEARPTDWLPQSALDYSDAHSARITAGQATAQHRTGSNHTAREGSGLSSLTRDKWIGLGLAISSSLAIGTSFIITKKGLMDAADRSTGTGGMASDGHYYLQNPIWWAGMSTMIVGEVANFAAYTFAPPILVTPLGALSVLIGAVLASFILKEELGSLGRVGCTLCLVGTVIIVVNAPEDKEIQTVDEILNYAIQPGFLTYCLFVLGYAIWAIWRLVPIYGKRTPLVYLSICSLVGSVSVMAVKGFGVALKLTLDGNNQFTHPSTYCFALVTVVCILVQMNYFNKALDQFSTNIVNPIYYVTFTTSTIFASFLLFNGFNTSGPASAVSLLGGFCVIFMGVYLLNLNRLVDPATQQPRMSLMTGEGVAGTGRLSEAHDRLLGNNDWRGRSSMQYPPSRRGSYPAHTRRDSSGSVLFSAYDNEETVGLTQLNESDEDADDSAGSHQPKHEMRTNVRSAPAPLLTHARKPSLKAARVANGTLNSTLTGAPRATSPQSAPTSAAGTRTPVRPTSVGSTSSVGSGVAHTPSATTPRSPSDWRGVPYVTQSDRR
ncbi:DUF803-domain-containing protein [Ceraceosorus guamensis]|uniref:DUF803-domain-containing protein n=1 Tax=Ceraceosorus guamensis TaxID=1522189 RepID=A0A316W7F9_9BASI|nr:DUF803-domain-containing protein [Ceraceosorus guamensis]PWN43585.1 DUF803-domain-containing protein [Ceraceosorus guamensis]